MHPSCSPPRGRPRRFQSVAHCFPPLRCTAAFLGFLLSTAAAQQFLQPDELHEQPCGKLQPFIVSRVLVSSEPQEAVDVVSIPNVAPSYTVKCVSFHESVMSSQLDTADACPSGRVVSICSAPESDQRAWTCQDTSFNSRGTGGSVTVGNVYSDNKVFKLTWKPLDKMDPLCFPRALTVLVQGKANSKRGSSTIVSIVFGLLGGVLGLAVLIYGAVALHNAIRKRKRERKEQRHANAIDVAVAPPLPRYADPSYDLKNPIELEDGVLSARRVVGYDAEETRVVGSSPSLPRRSSNHTVFPAAHKRYVEDVEASDSEMEDATYADPGHEMAYHVVPMQRPWYERYTAQNPEGLVEEFEAPRSAIVMQRRGGPQPSFRSDGYSPRSPGSDSSAYSQDVPRVI